MDAFTVKEQPHYLELSFHIPSTANAFSLSAAQELGRIQSQYLEWKKAVVVRSGHARMFCSGGNLSDYQRLESKPEGLKINEDIESILNQFGAWPVIKLAFINGDVLGGGMEWLARFDYRWSTATAAFAFWQRRIGLSTGWGGGRAWARRIGEGKQRQLLLEGRLLGAQEARATGLIDRVLSEWSVERELLLWGESLSVDPDVTSQLSAWSTKSERDSFHKLWMATSHRAALKRWTKKPT